MSEPVPSQAVCPTHPGHAAVGLCARCATFICQLDRKVVDGQVYCARCAVRPDVDYLEAFRLANWGKRDGWAWFIGLSGLLTLPGAAFSTAARSPALLLYLGVAAVSVCFWLGLSWARPGLVAAYATVMAVGLIGNGPMGLGTGIPFLISLAILADTRNKLFFKVQVSRHALKKAWHQLANNVIARTGFQASILGLLVPGIAVIGLACSIVGWRRVDPAARPPVGRKAEAIAGTILGLLGTLGWGGLLGYYWLSRWLS